MKKTLLFMLACLLTVGLFVGCQPNSTASASLTKDIKKEDINTSEKLTAENNIKFLNLGTNLFKETLNKTGENSLISPLSIVSALAMTENGAVGDTLKEFEDTFGFSKDLQNAYLNAYIKSLPNEEGSKFNLANSIWINSSSSFSPNEEFLKTNKNYFDAEIYTDKFNDAAKDKINSWVAKNTDDMIKSVLDKINEDSIMYLINALAFDGKWEEPYEEGFVAPDTFTKEDGSTTEADFMYAELNSYIKGENETGFKKDYKDGKYSFVALLPNEGIKISDYVKGLSGESLYKLLNNISSEEVKTLLPKFETNYGLSLNESLKALGIKKAFSGEANFSNMGKADNSILISDVIHKTYIKVDEKGTKAAAVTSVEMKTASMPFEESKEVYLTRPFVYMIVDNSNNLPIFIGALMDVK